jgi:hypothetical protein
MQKMKKKREEEACELVKRTPYGKCRIDDIEYICGIFVRENQLTGYRVWWPSGLELRGLQEMESKLASHRTRPPVLVGKRPSCRNARNSALSGVLNARKLTCSPVRRHSRRPVHRVPAATALLLEGRPGSGQNPALLASSCSPT